MRRALLVVALAGCTQSAADAGDDRFHDPRGFSEYTYNTFSCATCHQTAATADPAERNSGFSLYGVAARTSFWGGREIRLLDAVNQCVVYFLRGDALGVDGDASRQLYEYLVSLTPEGADPTPLPMTIPEAIVAIPLGDATRGGTLYTAACARCHGAAHTGRGNIIKPDEVILPEYTDGYDQDFPGVPKGLVVIEKIRHGAFFNVGGVMAPFPVEQMSDGEIGDVLAFLNLPSE